MKKFSAITLLILFAFSLPAQTIKWGEQVKLKGKSRMSKIISADSASFISVIAQYKVVGKPDAVVDFYKFPSLASQETKIVPEGEGEMDVMYKLRDQVFAFSVLEDKSKKVIHAFATNANDPAGMKISLGTIDYTRPSQRGKFDFVESVDHSKLLVIQNPPFEKYNMEEFKLTLFDAELNQLWEKPIKLPYLDQDFKIIKSKVDDKGNVYLLTAHKDIQNKQSDLKGLPLKSYTVLAYNKTENRLKEFDIKLKDKWVNGLNIAFDNQDGLTIGGFYSTSKDYSISGTFFLTIDTKTLSIKSKSLNPFKQGFLDQFNSGKRLEGNKKLDDFYFDHLVVAEDGSIYFTAEQYYVRTTSYYDHRTGVTNYTYYYHYNDIVVVKMDAKAKMVWTKRIPKRQVTNDDNGYYSGYTVASYEGALKILYNDNSKNFDPNTDNKDRPMNNPQKSMATILSIDKDGQITKKPLFSAQEYQTILQPRMSKLIDKGKILVYTQKGKTFRFATINFSE
jgi:hypothetical protein